jgi:hypothetical protein
LRTSFAPLLAAIVDLPEAVAEKLLYYVDFTEGFTADDLVSMRMMALLGLVSIVAWIGAGFRPEPTRRAWLMAPWVTVAVQIILLPIPLASLRATLIVHSVVPGLIAFQMFGARSRCLLLPTCNVLLFYKIAAFALADNGANLRPTLSMLGGFVR